MSLEKNLTDLDNDFITLWSKYILSTYHYYHNLTNGKFSNTLISLAELGQINALQSVPLFDDIKFTPKIHEFFNQMKIKKTSDRDYNEELFVLNYCFKTGYRFDNKGIYDMLDYTLKKHKLSYELADDPLILERYFEIKKGWGNLVNKLSIKKLRKKLEELYFSAHGSNIAIMFAYGKNLIFFGNRTERKYGASLLSALANREYSKELMEYKEKEHNNSIDEVAERLYKDFQFD